MQNKLCSEQQSLRGDKSCRNCGKGFPHQGRKTSCPAYRATCHKCGKTEHFKAVCYSTRSGFDKGKHRMQVNRVEKSEASEVSDEDSVYIFSLGVGIKCKSEPLFRVKVNGVPMEIITDSGASINILNESDYRELGPNLRLEQSNVKIYAYQSTKPFRVLGKFETTVPSESRTVRDKFYVVSGSGVLENVTAAISFADSLVGRTV